MGQKRAYDNISGPWLGALSKSSQSVIFCTRFELHLPLLSLGNSRKEERRGEDGVPRGENIFPAVNAFQPTSFAPKGQSEWEVGRRDTRKQLCLKAREQQREKEKTSAARPSCGIPRGKRRSAKGLQVPSSCWTKLHCKCTI